MKIKLNLVYNFAFLSEIRIMAYLDFLEVILKRRKILDWSDVRRYRKLLKDKIYVEEACKRLAWEIANGKHKKYLIKAKHSIIKTIAEKRKRKKNKKWGESEISYMLEHIPKDGIVGVSLMLGRTVRSVRCKYYSVLREGKMRKVLTKNQLRVYDYIVGYLKRYGEAPLLMEIKENFGFKRDSQAHFILKALERKGFIKRLKRVRRGIIVNYEKSLEYSYNEVKKNTKV